MTVPPAVSRLNLVAAGRPYFRVLALVVLFLAGTGLYSIQQMPSGIYPEVAFPRIVIIATVANLGVKSVEVSVARPLEEAANAVQGAVRVRSKTVRGAAELSVDFAPGTDMVQALNDLRARISDAASALPAGTQLIIERQTPSVFPIISVVVTGNRSLSDLRDFAYYDLRPRLSRIPDVSYVIVQGGDVREVVVEVDPLALVAAGLSLDELAVRLGQAQRLRAVGRLDRTAIEYQVLSDTLVDHPEQLEDVVVFEKGDQLLRLGDVARVSVGQEDRQTAVRADGRDAVVLTVFRRLGGDALGVSRELEDVLRQARATAPPGVEIRTAHDQADLIRTSLANIRDAMLLGGLFGALTLLAFLRSVRAMLIAMFAVVATFLISFVFLRLSGDTLNLMSLGGLAVAIGLVIDDAVVVIDNIARHLQAGQATDEAIDAASREIGGAVIGATLTTVLVFVPLAFVPGVVGQFFQSLSLSLAIAVVVSMVVSLTLVPVLAATLLAGRRLPPPGRFFQATAKTYDWAVRAVLRRPRRFLAAALLVAVPGYLLYGSVETGFMPEMDEGAFVLDYYMPTGTALNETDRVLRDVESILLETPGVSGYVRRTGVELGFFATEPFTGDILVTLNRDRRRRMEAVIAELREKITARVPQLDIEFVPLIADEINDLMGIEAPLEVKVFGPDYAVLREVAIRVGTALEQISGVVAVDPHVRLGNPDIVVHTDSTAARRAGLSVEQVENQLHAALFGQIAFVLPQEDRLTKVRIRYPDRLRYDLHALPEIPLLTPGGSTLPLRAVASLDHRRSLNELWREDQQPMINVTAEIQGRDLGGATRDVQRQLAGLAIPPGYRWELAGDYRNQQQAFRDLLVVLLVAASLVYLLMAVQFKSILLPALNFLTTPLSLTAALLALWLTGTPLNVSSLMGAILLIGLDVKNGILLIERVGQLRSRGTPLEQSLAEAGRERFRPILITSLTTLFGLLPLALGIGPGAQMQQPLAIAVIGGLTANMVFTRLVIPAGYLVLQKAPRRQPR